MALYEGQEPYIFASYAHKDAARAVPVLEYLQQQGFRLWYDAGIEAGSEWPENIARHLVNSACVVALVTGNYLGSRNCCEELHFARNREKKVLLVYLEDVVLPLDLELRLGLAQALFYSRYKGAADFLQSLAGAQLLSPCRICENVQPEAATISRNSEQTAKQAFDKALALYQGRHFREAVNGFRLASDQGDVRAKYFLGICHMNGYGVVKDLAAGENWYLKAAQQGYAPAQYALGSCYDHGSFGQKNMENAAYWYSQAAEQGYAEAQCSLGYCYAAGKGVQKDSQEAIRWLRKAMEQGNGRARVLLSRMAGGYL